MAKKKAKEKAVEMPDIYRVQREGAAFHPLAIVVVMWNNLELNKKCVESIRQHTKDYDLILVNNGSTDGTKEWLYALLEDWQEDACLTVVNQGNLGWPKGVNEGLKNVLPGQHVLWMNNDIEVTPGWAERMLVHLTADKDAGIVGPVTNFVMGLQKQELNDRIDGDHHYVNYLIGFCMLVKNEVIAKVGGLDESFWDVPGGSGSADDIDYSIRVRNAGYKLVIARDVAVVHHGSKSFEIIYGKDLYQPGTEAHTNYMADVDKYLKRLREKFGNAVVDETMTIPRLPKPKPQAAVGTIGIPHGEFIPADTFTSLLSLNIPGGVAVITNFGSAVAKARNNIVDNAQGEWVAFIDSDMTFKPDALVKLLAHLENPEVDIVTAICYRKVPNYEPCIFSKTPGSNPGYTFLGDWPNDRLFEIDACGSAFLVIRRSVFEALGKPYYKYSDFLSEDLDFCRRAKAYGFRIWADPTVKIGHLRMLPVGEAVYRANPGSDKMAEETRAAHPELWNFGIKKAPSANAEALGQLARAQHIHIDDNDSPTK